MQNVEGKAVPDHFAELYNQQRLCDFGPINMF